MRVLVVNKRRGERGEYCGRPSPLGNPYHARQEEDRDAVCDLYAQWFAKQIEQQNERVLRELRRLYRIGKDNGIVRLQCWCAPKRCHCNTIKAFLEAQAEANGD